MVDMTALTGMHSGAQADKRTAKRRAAELRLKIYGMVAIFLAAAALVALLSSVLGKATGALTQTYLTFPITIDAAEIDPDGTGDPKIIRRADFSGLTKDMLKAEFPSAKGRTVRRELYDLTSAGAPFELADMVAANPALVGQTIDFRFLASDVTDLYLKDDFGALIEKPTQGNLTLTAEGDSYIVSSTEGDFDAALARVKEALVDQAAAVRRKAALQENGVVEFTRRAEVADENRTVLIQVADGWLKMTRITPTGGLAEPVIPMAREVTASNSWGLFVTDLPENSRKVSDNQIVWIETLKSKGQVDQVFNSRFFTSGDSREPELAGILGAAVGSFWTMVVTFALAFPIGVAAAIYLEEFAPKNKLTDFIEVNINGAGPDDAAHNHHRLARRNPRRAALHP